MTGFVKFPDATNSTFSAQNVGGWSVNSSNVTLAFIGIFQSSQYVLNAFNPYAANRIIFLLNQWWTAGANTFLDLGIKLGTVIGSVSPGTWIAANSQSVTLTGWNFQTGMNIIIGGVVYAASITDIGDATASYNGGDLPSGTYDVTITNLDGSTYTMPLAVVLT